MKKTILLMILPILMAGCTPHHAEQNEYTNKQLGIQIVIPNNWKPISSSEAGQDDIVWEEGEIPPTDELRLGYFDPDTGEHEGTFILFNGGKISSEQDREDLEKGMQGYDKIRWKDRMCYHGMGTSEKNTTYESYTIIKDDTVVCFMMGYSQTHADQVIRILEGVNF